MERHFRHRPLDTTRRPTLATTFSARDICGTQDCASEGVPPLKTCPVCHRVVPDTATTCPHQGCGHVLPVGHTDVKRPPPPPTRVQIASNDVHPATPQPIAPQPAAAAKRSRWPMILWLAAIVLGSALVAVGLLEFLPLHPAANESVAINTHVQPPEQKSSTSPSTAQQPSIKHPPAQLSDQEKSGDRSAAETDQKVAEAASQPAPLTAKPHDTPGIVADPSTEMPPADGPAGILADAPRKPLGVSKEPLGVPKDPLGLTKEPPKDPLGLAEEPKPAIVANTPKGLYAERTKPKTPEWLAARGGTSESQQAVEDGLNWLARHQGGEGHWGADCLGTGANSRCDQNAPCQVPGGAYEIAHTGLALLAFQAAGHYYFNDQKYSGQVAKGLDYLVQEQAPDGSIVGSLNPTAEQIKAGARFNQYFMYEHAMGTFALCEACAVAIAERKKSDPRYQAAAQRAVDFIVSVQHNDGGWRYQVDPKERSDCSVSGWPMLALKTAREAKVRISPQTIPRMMRFFAAHYADGRTNYQIRTPGTDALTGVGMMAVEFFEHNLGSPIVQGGAAYLAGQADALAPQAANAAFAEFRFPDMKGLPAGFAPFLPVPGNNYYLWYNCTMAMFQVGGEPWQRWNGALRDRLIAMQVPGEGCDRGSWPPNDSYSGQGGRIYSTALAVLTLEVYYRFQRIAGPEKENFFKK